MHSYMLLQISTKTAYGDKFTEKKNIFTIILSLCPYNILNNYKEYSRTLIFRMFQTVLNDMNHFLIIMY